MLTGWVRRSLWLPGGTKSSWSSKFGLSRCNSWLTRVWHIRHVQRAASQRRTMGDTVVVFFDERPNFWLTLLRRRSRLRRYVCFGGREHLRRLLLSNHVVLDQ